MVTSTNPTGGATAWTVTPLGGIFGSNRDLSGVSCPSVSLCVVIDQQRDVINSTNPTGGAGAWTSTHIGGGLAGLTGVSSETAWDHAGTGCSAYEPKPAWQKDVSCQRRTVADVSAVADPASGLGIYDTANNCGTSSLCDHLIELGVVAGLDGWAQVGHQPELAADCVGVRPGRKRKFHRLRQLPLQPHLRVIRYHHRLERKLRFSVLVHCGARLRRADGSWLTRRLARVLVDHRDPARLCVGGHLQPTRYSAPAAHGRRHLRPVRLHPAVDRLLGSRPPPGPPPPPEDSRTYFSCPSATSFASCATVGAGSCSC